MMNLHVMDQTAPMMIFFVAELALVCIFRCFLVLYVHVVRQVLVVDPLEVDRARDAVLLTVQIELF